MTGHLLCSIFASVLTIRDKQGRLSVHHGNKSRNKSKILFLQSRQTSRVDSFFHVGCCFPFQKFRFDTIASLEIDSRNVLKSSTEFRASRICF